MRRLRHPPSVARRMGAAGDSKPGIEGLFEGLQKLAEGLQAVSEKGERAIEIAGQEGKMVFGYTLRTMEGVTRAEPFGHVPKPRGEAPAEPAARQPIIDLFEEPDCLRVIAEMPGVAEADLRARVEEGALVLESVGARRWHKRLPLPAAVDAAGLTLASRNGIVELRLPRASETGS